MSVKRKSSYEMTSCFYNTYSSLLVRLLIFIQLYCCKSEIHEPTRYVKFPTTTTQYPTTVDEQLMHMRPTATMIFLPGFGDNTTEWFKLLQEIKPPYMRLYRINADERETSMYNGTLISAWFDIYIPHPETFDDAPGINQATECVHSIIDAEIHKGLPSNRILIGGFDQGGALALHSALAYPKKLGGIIALSTWVPFQKNFSINLNSTYSANKNIPILQCHGFKDTIVTHDAGRATHLLLKKLSNKTQFKTYHGVLDHKSEQVKDDMKVFMEKRFPEMNVSLIYD